MSMVEYITDDGKEMLAQMLAGKITITFTKIQMGDGTLAIGQSRRTMTHLVNLIKELEVYRVKVTEENVVSIMGIFDNSDMTSGFWFREKGVFASDGINEVLFAYANAGDSAEYINPPTVESVEKQIISLYTNLQSTEKEVNINVVSGIYALNEDVEKHTFNTENPHGVTKSQVGLGNVPNVATNDQTPTYTVSTSNAELTSGEKLSVAFGKIAKAVSTLISHIATSATSSVLGHVKLSDSLAVTDSTALALPATEKNASIKGTLANQISALDTDLAWKLAGGTTKTLEQIHLPSAYREIIVELSVSGLILNSINISRSQLKEQERGFTSSYYASDYYAAVFKATNTYVYASAFASNGVNANGNISVYYR